LVGHTEIERLDAHRITREHDFARSPGRPAVEECERVHAVQPPEEFGAPFLPAVHQNFGVGPCTKAVAQRRKLVPQIEVVIQLAVQHDPHAPVLVRHGLGTQLQIDDAQPAVTEGRGSALEKPETAPVGSPVRERLRETFDQRPHVAAPIPSYRSRDAAHAYIRSLSGPLWLPQALWARHATPDRTG